MAYDWSTTGLRDVPATRSHHCQLLPIKRAIPIRPVVVVLAVPVIRVADVARPPGRPPYLSPPARARDDTTGTWRGAGGDLAGTSMTTNGPLFP